MKDLGLFRGLSDASIEWLLANASARVHEAGTSVVNEGEDPNALFIVSAGLYAACIGHDEDEQELGRLAAGSVFGEMAWLGRTVASARVRALERSEALVLPLAALEDKLKNDHDFAAEFMRTLAGVLVERQRSSNVALALGAAAPAVACAARGEFLRVRDALDTFRAVAARCDKEERANGSLGAGSEQELRQSLTDVLESLEDTCSSLARKQPAAAQALGARVQAELLPFLLTTQTALRCYAKPRGYAGDFQTIDDISERRAGGVGVGRAIDRFFVEHATAAAVRNRRQLVASRLAALALSLSQTEQLAVTSLACGPAREISDVLMLLPRHRRPQVTLADIDPQALDYAASRLDAEGFGAHVRTARVNLIRLALGRERLELPPQHVIYGMGLIDYFSDEFVVHLLNWMHARLAPGGQAILGNLHPRNPARALMDYVLEWKVIHRTEEDLQRLFAASAFAGAEEFLREHTGVHVFALGRKGGERVDEWLVGPRMAPSAY